MNTKPRFKLAKVFPQVYKPLTELDTLLADAEITRIQKEMIKIRTSQINGCAYCLNIHSKDALKYGERQERIFVMSAWREARNWFSEEDQVILALTEQITLIANHGVTDELFEKSVELFGEKTTANIILSITLMNAWNRLGVSFGNHPE